MAQLCTQDEAEADRTPVKRPNSRSSRRKRSKCRVGSNSTSRRAPVVIAGESCASEQFDKNWLEKIYNESLELSELSKRLMDLLRPVIDGGCGDVQVGPAESRSPAKNQTTLNSVLKKPTRAQRQRRRQGQNYQKVADLLLSPRKSYVRFRSPT